MIYQKQFGQYFTHPVVARFMSKLINPKTNQHIIDPACGDGEFLYQLHQLCDSCFLYGCEIDTKVIPLAKQRVDSPYIYLHNGLYSKKIFKNETDLSYDIKDNFFDAVIANPPFNGLQHKVKQKEILSLFELSYKNGRLRTTQSIEILFLERFAHLLKPNGKLCTILPEGLLSDQRLQYVRDWLEKHFTVEALIFLPKRGVFGNADVRSVIFCARKKPNAVTKKDVFFARDFELDELELIFSYMDRNQIFVP